MNEALELQLQEDFPFMKRNISEHERNTTYQKWGCEVSGDGWYPLLHALCQAITDRYLEDNMPVEEIIIVQIKQKYGALKFYYSFEGSPIFIHALDSLGGTSIRFYPTEVDNDNQIKNLRLRDIAKIVRAYEDRSKTTCEACGNQGSVIRMEMNWKQTLCDDCYGKYLKKLKDNGKRGT
ncbi:hypothetical protein D3C73_657060 [compost metagenome]